MQVIPGIRPAYATPIETAGTPRAHAPAARTPTARIEGDWKLAQPSASVSLRAAPGTGPRDNLETAGQVLRAMGSIASLAAAVTTWTEVPEGNVQ